jgi:Glycosyltransferase family 87
MERAASLLRHIDSRLTPRAPRIFLVLYLLLGVQSWWVETRKSGDFDVFYLAAKNAVAAKPLYADYPPFTPYRYAPTFAVLIAPVGVFPRPVAGLVWNIVSALALTSFFTWSARRFGRDPPFTSQLAVFALVLPFTVHCLRLGQTEAILLWLAARSEELAERRPVLSGASWAVAALTKPPFLVLGAPALFARQWSRIGWFLVFAILGLLVPIVFYGLTGTLTLDLAWFRHLESASTIALCSRENQSAWAIACTYLATPPGPAYTASVALLGGGSALMGSVAAAVVWKRDPEQGRLVAIALALWLASFLSPLGWRTGLIGTMPALHLLLVGARDPQSGPSRTIQRLVLGGVFLVQRLDYEVVGRKAFFWLLAHQQLGISAAVAVLAGLVGTATFVLRTPPRPSTCA